MKNFKTLKKLTKVAMATAILATTFVSVTHVSAEDKESKAKGRVELYHYNKNDTGENYPSLSESFNYGMECVINIDVKKPNKQGFHQDYKYSVKAKGVKALGIGDDFCKEAQIRGNVVGGYNKHDGLVGSSNITDIQLIHQGEKIAVESALKDKKLINKYYKSGVLPSKNPHVNVIYTYVVHNPKSLPNHSNYHKNFKKYVRTPRIANKNVVMKNIHPVDGQDTITVKNIKKGTRLNFYSGEGVLYKSVKVNATSYTLKSPKNKDISKALFSGLNKTSKHVIISRTEPNSHESYRMKYKIPKQKAQQHTKLNIYDLNSNYEFNVGSIVFEGDSVYVSQQSEVGKNPATYRVKYNGKTVFTFSNTAKELVYDDEYFFDREYKKGTKEYNFFYSLTNLPVKELKKYTFTAQVKGKQESYPMQYLYPKAGTLDYHPIEVFE